MDSRTLFHARFCHYLIFSPACPYCGTNGEEWGGSPKWFVVTRNTLGGGDCLPKEAGSRQIRAWPEHIWETEISQEIHEDDLRLLGFQIGCCVKALLHFQGENRSQS